MPFSNIDKPSKYFTAKTYTGTGSTQSITGLEFSPDWVWLKDRSSTNGHFIYDIIRGATNYLGSHTYYEDQTSATSLTSFNSDGFSLGSYGGTNTSSNNYISWNWDANGTGVSNTSGTISSTVSANTTSGFSIVSYTASSNGTVGHGLGTAPKFMIFKNRNLADYNWVVYSSAFSSPQSDFLYLNTTNAKSTISNYWTSTAPTSTVFSVGSTGSYYNDGNMIAYCFAEVKGFSKFGSYTGNGSNDGTFIYTGFKPAFIMIKRTDTAGYSWIIHDNKRNTYNPDGAYLQPDTSNEEGTLTTDILSNGFKLRLFNNTTNASGATHIYMAFAESPFVSSKSIPTTAR